MRHTLILRIAIPSPLPQLFDYLAPENSAVAASNLRCGVRIKVPFGNRQLVGFLMETSTDSEYDLAKLKPALEILDAEPVLTDSMLALVNWCAEYYHYPVGECLASVLPTLLRKGGPVQSAQQTLCCLSDDGKGLPENALKSAPKQAALLALLQRKPFLNKRDLDDANITRSIVSALIKKGLVQELQREITHEGRTPTDELRETPLHLNDEQELAVQAVNSALQSFSPFLLEGITGSGKTEVYLQIIHAALQAGKQALVLVPEIGLTPQTVNRFRSRFRCHVAVMHSGLNDRERLNNWVEASRGDAQIVIGTRSAIFTPLPKPGIIIIDEEHDLSFKQQDGFRYNARDIAVKRARDEGIPIVLGSATPSIESLYNVSYQRYQHLTLSKRAGNASVPQYSLLDIRRQSLDEGFSEELLSAIAKEIEAQNQVLVFINRRGYAPTLMCHDCGWIAQCRHCDSRMTVHRDPPHLHCHHCDHQQALKSHCPDCRSMQLNFLGQGTERSELALQRLFPDTRVLRVDRDTTQRKLAMQNILEEVQRGEPMILVGTQMLAKGHHFPAVTLVAIMDVDSGLFSADFRGPERMGQLMVQVAGRAGRAERAGRVIIQTHFPDHPLINTLIQRGYHPYAQDLLAERKQQSNPPCAFFALIRAEDKQHSKALEFLQQIRQLAANLEHPIGVLGPLAAPLQKRAGRYRFQLLLQSRDRASLHRALKSLRQQLAKDRLAKQLRWSIDIDPQDMF